jgi:heme A synthase
MKRVYAVLAFVICGLVAVQAAAAVWAESGLFLWITQGGGVIDQSTLESDSAPPFPEAAGFAIHGMNGMMVIPVVALLLLVVSFLAKVPRGIPWAVGVAVLVALQVTLGILGHSVSIAGFSHGINALLLFTVSLLAGLRAWRASAVEPAAAANSALVG